MISSGCCERGWAQKSLNGHKPRNEALAVDLFSCSVVVVSVLYGQNATTAKSYGRLSIYGQVEGDVI